MNIRYLLRRKSHFDKLSVKRIIYLFTFTLPLLFPKRFVSVKGKEIITPDGKPILLKGINLGNWLNPEGYMFKFKNVNSFRLD